MERNEGHNFLFCFPIIVVVFFNAVQSLSIPLKSSQQILTPTPNSNSLPKSQPVSYQPSKPPKARHSRAHIPSPWMNPSPLHYVPSPSSTSKKQENNLRTNILSLNPDPSSINNPEIKKICDSTDHPDLCTSCIAPYYTGKTDPVSVLDMVMKATYQNIKIAASTMTSLTHGLDPAEGSICQELYADALQNLQQAMDALPNHDVPTINSMLSAAITDFSMCVDEMAIESPTFYPNDKLTQMVSNCLAIASLLN